LTHRPYRPGPDDSTLAGFRCSTGTAFEDEVEAWINHDAIAWLNDLPYATFQRRHLSPVEAADGEAIAVYAWQDITRIDIDGIWLEVLAVAVNHQHSGAGRAVLAEAKTHIVATPHDGEAIAGLVHPDNHRSRNMLLVDGWTNIGQLEGHDLLVGRLP
jgi:hypothetical protein